MRDTSPAAIRSINVAAAPADMSNGTSRPCVVAFTAPDTWRPWRRSSDRKRRACEVTVSLYTPRKEAWKAAESLDPSGCEQRCKDGVRLGARKGLKHACTDYAAVVGVGDREKNKHTGAQRRLRRTLGVRLERGFREAIRLGERAAPKRAVSGAPVACVPTCRGDDPLSASRTLGNRAPCSSTNNSIPRARATDAALCAASDQFDVARGGLLVSKALSVSFTRLCLDRSYADSP
eukprot:scaffold22086_cov28-Tisochrysis_lutea.AAC.3